MCFCDARPDELTAENKVVHTTQRKIIVEPRGNVPGNSLADNNNHGEKNDSKRRSRHIIDEIKQCTNNPDNPDRNSDHKQQKKG